MLQIRPRIIPVTLIHILPVHLYFIFCLLENLDYYYISNFIYILGWPHTNLLALVVHYQLVPYHYHLAIWHILPLFIHV
jgi:hypothetical protein